MNRFLDSRFSVKLHPGLVVEGWESNWKVGIVILQTALFITFQVCNFKASREIGNFLFIQDEDEFQRCVICKLNLKTVHMSDDKLGDDEQPFPPPQTTRPWKIYLQIYSRININIHPIRRYLWVPLSVLPPAPAVISFCISPRKEVNPAGEDIWVRHQGL